MTNSGVGIFTPRTVISKSAKTDLISLGGQIPGSPLSPLSPLSPFGPGNPSFPSLPSLQLQSHLGFTPVALAIAGTACW